MFVDEVSIFHTRKKISKNKFSNNKFEKNRKNLTTLQEQFIADVVI
jgi:hypothetical protein